MRFIYDFKNNDDDIENDNIYLDYTENILTDYWNGIFVIHTIEDTQDNIIWLINSQKSYEEMREYYVKG